MVRFRIVLFYFCLSFIPSTQARGRDWPTLAEVQWTICKRSVDSMRSLAKESKTVTTEKWLTVYYDTKKFELLRRFEVIVRERERDDGYETDLKVKLDPASYQLRYDGGELAAYKCEYDIYSDGRAIGCKQRNRSSRHHDRFNKQQLNDLSRWTDYTLDDLRDFGPVRTENIKFFASVSSQPLSLELMDIRGEPRMELSVRVDLSKVSAYRKAIGEWLAENDIRTCEYEDGKTEAVLKAYSQ